MTNNPLSQADREAAAKIVSGQRITNMRKLLNGLLDKGYDNAVNPVVRAMVGNVKGGVIDQRLKELTVEAERLAGLGLRLTPDNPVFGQLMTDLRVELRKNGQFIRNTSPTLQESAINAAAVLSQELVVVDGSRIGIRFNVPDPEAVAKVVEYTRKPAFREMILNYESSVWLAVNNQAIRGIVEGWGPLKTAREIRRLIEGYSISEANNLMRTLQLTAYRDAAVAHQVANADIISSVIRVAVLDARTCLSCISLHGTRLAVGERVNDHHQGRCFPINELKGFPRNIPTGESWFNSLPNEEPTADQPITKLDLMGYANYQAWSAGKVKLEDFIHPYTDPVFGEMIRENSLKGILGPAAQDYYQ